MRVSQRGVGHRRGSSSARAVLVIAISALALIHTAEGRVGSGSHPNASDQRTGKKAAVHEERARKLSRHIQRRYSVKAHKAKTIVNAAFAKGAELDIPPALILAVIAVESTFRDRAVSRAGARGLMQVVPKWHPEQMRAIGGPQALFDPRKNIHAGAHILARYLHLSRGDLRKALLRYNGSLKNPRSRYADKVLRKYESLRQASSV